MVHNDLCPKEEAKAESVEIRISREDDLEKLDPFRKEGKDCFMVVQNLNKLLDRKIAPNKLTTMQGSN